MKDPTTSIRNDVNKLKVHEKTRFKSNLNSFDDAIWVILENKTNATSHPNIRSLKTAIEEGLIKCLNNIFGRHANCFECLRIQLLTKMMLILSKFTVLCLSSYFVFNFFKIRNKLV